jgi:hypothetical protein
LNFENLNFELNFFRNFVFSKFDIMKIQFTPEDIQFMQTRGSNPEEVQRQFSFFEKGFDFVNLDRPATIDDGIVRLEEEQIEELG